MVGGGRAGRLRASVVVWFLAGWRAGRGALIAAPARRWQRRPEPWLELSGPLDGKRGLGGWLALWFALIPPPYGTPDPNQ